MGITENAAIAQLAIDIPSSSKGADALAKILSIAATLAPNTPDQQLLLLRAAHIAIQAQDYQSGYQLAFYLQKNEGEISEKSLAEVFGATGSVLGISGRGHAMALREVATILLKLIPSDARPYVPNWDKFPDPQPSENGTADAKLTGRGIETAGGQVLIGVQYIGFSIDRDVIKVGSGYGKFDKVRLRVLDNDIFINEMRVIFNDGHPDVLAVAANVPANTSTKWLALKGDRFIKEIELVYKTRPGFKGQARVEAYGEHAEGWHHKGQVAAGDYTPSGEAFKHAANRGWLYLGGQQPLFFSVKKGLGYESDTVSVARNWGFNRLRLDVKDRAVTLNRLTVVYGDGTTDVFPFGAKVDAGSSFGPINLKSKPVREIQLSYRSRLLDAQAASKGYAFVEFWAQ